MLIALIMSLLLVGRSQQSWWTTARSKSITTENYNKYLGTDKHLVLKFYAPWCYYCEMMSAEYDKLYDHYKKNQSIVIGRVNCQDNKELCQALGVRGYPSIYYYAPGEKKMLNEYQSNERTAHKLSQWIEMNYKMLSLNNNNVQLV